MKSWGIITKIVVVVAVMAMAGGCRKPIKGAPLGGGQKPGNGVETVVPHKIGDGLSTPQSDKFKPNEDWIRSANWTQLPKIYFDTDSSMIRQGDRPKLEQIADYLKTNSQQYMLVAGHCDERGTAEYNRALGERRANSAREYLIRLGVNPDRIATISYGKDRPADMGHTESAWWKNRRCEFGVGPL